MAAKTSRRDADIFWKLLVIYVSIVIFVTYLRYAEWYDASKKLSYGLPYYFSYTEGAIRGAVSAVAVSALILLVLHRFVVAENPRPELGASMVLVAYLSVIGASLLTPPSVFDMGLAIDLILVGIVAAVSTYLYAQAMKLSSERTVANESRLLKQIELEHKETTELISTLTWVILFAAAAMVYNQYVLFWHDLSSKYGAANPVIWQVFNVAVFRLSIFVVGLVWFLMAPLFYRLKVIKRKLQEGSY